MGNQLHILNMGSGSAFADNPIDIVLLAQTWGIRVELNPLKNELMIDDQGKWFLYWPGVTAEETCVILWRGIQSCLRRRTAFIARLPPYLPPTAAA